MSSRRLCTESLIEGMRAIAEPEPTYLYMENMPAEVLSLIFQHLSPEVNLSILPLVCRRWAEIQTNRPFFTDLTFSDAEPSTEVCVFITSRARFLRSMTLICRADANSILEVIDDCTPLEKVTVVDRKGFCLEEHDNISGLRQTELFPGVFSRKMQDLTMEHIPVSGNGCSDQGVRTLCEQHKQTLEVLILDARELTNATLERISECNQITTLHLRRLREATDEGIAHLRSLQNLRSLLISYCDVTVSAWRGLLSNQNFPDLQVVKIIGCSLCYIRMLNILISVFPENLAPIIQFPCMMRSTPDYIALRTSPGYYEIQYN